MLESLWNGVRMLQPGRGFRLGTDSVLLAEFLSLPANASVADLGAGCGTLGLLLCARDPGCTVTGLELRESACALAQENITLNALSSRLSVRQGDVRGIASYFPACSFDCVISNPPYFPVGSGKVSEDAAVARTELCLNLDELCAAAGECSGIDTAHSGCAGVNPTSASMLLFSVALMVVSKDWIHAETIFLSYG